jgi:hypothetical protein
VTAQVQCPQYRARQPEPPVADGGDQARFGAPDGDDDITDRRIIGATVFALPPILDAGRARLPAQAARHALRHNPLWPGARIQVPALPARYASAAARGAEKTASGGTRSDGVAARGSTGRIHPNCAGKDQGLTAMDCLDADGSLPSGS